MPLSPHLTVYKPQFSSTLSIFHRITGAILALFILCYVLVVHFCTLSTITVTPIYNIISYFTNASIADVQATITCILDYWYVNLAAILLMSLLFHICHGFRHLFWDTVSAVPAKNVSPTDTEEVLHNAQLSAAAAAYKNETITKVGISISIITVILTTIAIFI